MAIDALFRNSHFYDRIYVQHLLFLDVAVYGHSPRAGFEILGQLGGFVFVGRKFVEVVVVGDILVGRFFFGGTERAFLETVDFCVGLGSPDGFGAVAALPERRGAANRRWEAQPFRSRAAYEGRPSRSLGGVGHRA